MSWQFPSKKRSPQNYSTPKFMMTQRSFSLPSRRFYELFFDDAVTASRELEITLTARNKDREKPVPMCGVPYHAADGYIARLLRKGYKVAICDQMEAAQKGVKLVKREVTRVITPGTVTDTNVLSPGENNFLLAITDDEEQLGCAFLDVSTGALLASQFAGAD